MLAIPTKLTLATEIQAKQMAHQEMERMQQTVVLVQELIQKPTTTAEVRRVQLEAITSSH